MTQEQLDKKALSTLTAWVDKMVKKFQADAKRLGEKEARFRWRDTYGLSFVREYTVKARFRHYKVFPWGEMPETSKRTIYAQQKQTRH